MLSLPITEARSPLIAGCLNIVHMGYLLEFHTFLPPPFLQVNRACPAQLDLLQGEACTLFEKGAVGLVSCHYRGHGFYFPYFLILKKGGDLCPILDLRAQNRLIRKF